MKNLKSNKKMVNAFIGFIGFALILSLSSCKCSGSSADESDITSEIADGDKTISSTLDNSEAVSEVSSEEITSENNSELTSEDSGEEGLPEITEIYDLYHYGLTEEEIAEKMAIIDEYRKSESFATTEGPSKQEKEKVYTAFLELYDMNKIIDLCNKYPVTEFGQNYTGYIFDKNIVIISDWEYVDIYYLDENYVPVFYICQYSEPDKLADYYYTLFEENYIYDIRIGTFYNAGLRIGCYNEQFGYILENSYKYNLTDEYNEYIKQSLILSK